jgi:hypothetical protein
MRETLRIRVKSLREKTYFPRRFSLQESTLICMLTLYLKMSQKWINDAGRHLLLWLFLEMIGRNCVQESLMTNDKRIHKGSFVNFCLTVNFSG